VIEGHVDAAELARLDDVLATTDAPVAVDYRIAGAIDTSHPSLDIDIRGEVPLMCQRCLQPFTFAVQQRTRVLLARNQQELAQLDEQDPEHEVILADAPLDAVSQVQDELVLTLPFVPRCPEQTCAALAGDHPLAGDEPGDHSSPFDALAQLKSNPETKPRR
jgi:uncharacterized protein